MLCSAARRSRRWSQLSATGGKVQEWKANCISLYSLLHNKMGFDIIYTIVREKKTMHPKYRTRKKKIQGLTLPLFQNLPASSKYACCEERKKKKERSHFHIVFSSLPKEAVCTKLLSPNCCRKKRLYFSNLINISPSKNLKKRLCFSNCKGQSVNRRDPSSLLNRKENIHVITQSVWRIRNMFLQQ